MNRALPSPNGAADGDVLTLDSGTAYGASWQTPSGGGGGGGDDVSINGAAVVGANLRDGTPVAPANSVNVAWQTSGSGPASISAYVTVDGVTLEISGGAVRVKADGIGNSHLRNSGALSVIGRSANSTGDPADISASPGSDAVLRESGSVLGFGTVATAGVANNAITYAKLQDVTANQRLIGAATTGDPSELAITTVLDWISSTRGSVLYRGAGGWAALAPSTDGYVLKDGGAGADPSWASVGGLTGLVAFYDYEAKVTGPTYHAASQEFFDSQSAGGYTNDFNPTATAGLSSAITAAGLAVTTPATAGATARLTGKYTTSFPSNDFSLTACIDLEGSGSANSSGGIAFLQGAGATDDVQIFGFRNGTALNVPRVGLFTSSIAFSSDGYLAGSGLQGRWFVALRYSVSTKAVTCWMGPTPESLSIVDTRTLTNAATLIAIVGQGVNNGGTATATTTVRFIRVVEEAYSATVPPTKVSGVRGLRA